MPEVNPRIGAKVTFEIVGDSMGNPPHVVKGVVISRVKECRQYPKGAVVIESGECTYTARCDGGNYVRVIE